MIAPIAAAVALSLQLEAGISSMALPADDTYIQMHLPGGNDRFDFATATFGAAVRADTRRLYAAAGWRNLGNEHMEGDLIEDADYLPCRVKPTTCPKPFEHWTSGGSTQQAFIELGYKASVAGLTVMPVVGVADNRIAWHTVITGEPWRAGPELHTSKTQWAAGPLAGLELSWPGSRLAAGLFLLNTAPDRSKDPWYPGQGAHTVYFRVTYRVGK